MDDSGIKKASELLKSVFGDVEIVKKAGRQHELLKAWTRLAGERLASHSRIVDLRETCLEVETDHPGWIQLLRMREKRILEGLRALFPEIEIKNMSIRIHKGDPILQTGVIERRVFDAVDTVGEEGSMGTDPIPEVSQELKDVLEKLGKSIRGKGGR